MVAAVPFAYEPVTKRGVVASAGMRAKSPHKGRISSASMKETGDETIQEACTRLLASFYAALDSRSNAHAVTTFSEGDIRRRMGWPLEAW